MPVAIRLCTVIVKGIGAETGMGLAREGLREMVLGSIALGLAAWGLSYLHWLAVVPVAAVWIWLITFFRDPRRVAQFEPGQMCSPADGKVTEITRLDYHEEVGGAAIRVGIFLSIFNVHINRAPCGGVVSKVTYQKGKFLDARDPDSGQLNEANTLVIQPEAPCCGPVVVRQVAGLIARRIICHASVGTGLGRGERFGMIKFGSRTELIVPDVAGTEVMVGIGQSVRAGTTLVLAQPLPNR